MSMMSAHRHRVGRFDESSLQDTRVRQQRAATAHQFAVGSRSIEAARNWAESRSFELVRIEDNDDVDSISVMPQRRVLFARLQED